MTGLKAHLYTFISILLMVTALLSSCTLHFPLIIPDAYPTPSPSEGTEETPEPTLSDDRTPEPSPEALPEPSPESTLELPAGITPVPPDVSTPESVTPESPEASASAYVRQEPEGVDVPARTPVDNSFFSDAAFIGNSLVEGLRLFSGITECDYFAATSMSVQGVGSVAAVPLENGGKGTILQALAQREYAKVYILLGINEIGCDPEFFKGEYAKMLDSIRDSQPDADIYIMSLTPVSYNKSVSSEIFNMERVKAYNKVLRELAEEKGCYYLDLCAALAGSDGYLPADVTSDGIHFSAKEYVVWADYLRTHYV